MVVGTGSNEVKEESSLKWEERCFCTEGVGNSLKEGWSCSNKEREGI